MALTGLKPTIAVLKPHLVPFDATRDEQRFATQPWRAWYNLKRWKDIRLGVLRRDLFTCQLCGHLEANTALLVCDHVNAHRGNAELFWTGPFETLCQQCHSIHKQSQESGTTAKHHPEWVRPSAIPLTIICGPPASGKSTHAMRQAGPFDVVIDLDVIASGLSGEPLHGWDRQRWLQPAIRKRNAMLAYLSRASRWKQAWFIIGEPKAEQREWWNVKLRPRAIIVMAPPLEVCMARARLDLDRDQARTINAIEAWWRDYVRRDGDTVSDG